MALFIMRLLILLLFSIAARSLFANTIGTNDSIPSVYFDGELKRQSFPRVDLNYTKYDIYKESDFLGIRYSNNILLNIKKNIKLSSPITFDSKCNIWIKGNGHTISEKRKFDRVKETKVYQATSWDYNESTHICTIKLPQALQKLHISKKDSVYISYELWFVRQKDLVLSAENGFLTFECKSSYKPDAYMRSWTPNPMFFLTYKTKKGIDNGLPTLLSVGDKAIINIENLKLIGSTDCILKNKGIVRLNGCYFTKGNSGAIFSSGSIYINHCTFSNIRNFGIVCDNESYSDICNSRFEAIGLKGTNGACIQSPSKLYVADCTFKNFNYSAIITGNISTDDEKNISISIIERNTMVWNKSWIEKIIGYGLKDSGAIYIGTNNKRAIIRNNTILNFGGHGLNRGIMCDDGSYNLTIYGNVISNTANYYDIDSRECSADVGRKIPKGYAMNTNNFIGYNYCDGKIKAQGASMKNNGCTFIQNHILGEKRMNIENDISNCNAIENAIIYDKRGHINKQGKLHVTN